MSADVLSICLYGLVKTISHTETAYYNLTCHILKKPKRSHYPYQRSQDWQFLSSKEQILWKPWGKFYAEHHWLEKSEPELSVSTYRWIGEAWTFYYIYVYMYIYNQHIFCYIVLYFILKYSVAFLVCLILLYILSQKCDHAF